MKAGIRGGQIRVAVADDHPVVREGVRWLLEKEPDVSVAFEASSGDELMGQINETTADVLVTDISMPGPPFLDLLGLLRRTQPRLPVIILTMHSVEQYAVPCFRAGAKGYLTKESLGSDLVLAVRRVAGGGRYVPATAAEALAAAIGRNPDPPPHHALSARELEVLRLSAAGLSVKRIARELSVSPKTVSTHRHRVRKKLGVNSQAAVVLYAARHGLVPTGASSHD